MGQRRKRKKVLHFGGGFARGLGLDRLLKSPWVKPADPADRRRGVLIEQRDGRLTQVNRNQAFLLARFSPGSDGRDVFIETLLKRS